MTKVELGISSIEGVSSSSFARVEMRGWVLGFKDPSALPTVLLLKWPRVMPLSLWGINSVQPVL